MSAFGGLGLFSQPIFFRYEMHDVTKSCITIKSPFKRQDRPMDFNITEYEKFTNMVLDSTVQPLRNYHLWNFAVMSKKDIHNYLISLLKYSFLFQIIIDFVTD